MPVFPKVHYNEIRFASQRGVTTSVAPSTKVHQGQTYGLTRSDLLPFCYEVAASQKNGECLTKQKGKIELVQDRGRVEFRWHLNKEVFSFVLFCFVLNYLQHLEVY